MKYVSPIPAGTSLEHYERGSEMLGYSLTPQGREVAGVLSAKRPDGRPMYRDTTVQLSRRSAKTTTIQCELLGRCSSIPRYKVLQTAQDGTRASEVFTQMLDELEAIDPELDPKARDWTAFRSTGREYIKWRNGSIWRVVAPKPGSFRSKAADVVWFDESGELDPEDSARIEAGALPTMDTRPDGQVIRSGTPGESRSGTFWKSLEAARANPARLGIVDYHATDEDVAGLDGEVFPAELIAEVHPGVIAELTTLEVIEERWMTMDWPKFMREYLCVWPPDTAHTAFDLAKIEACTVDPVAVPPAAWGLGYDVAIGGSAAANGAAWFDEDGLLHLQIMDHRMGSNWLAGDLQQAAKKHRGIPIAYDNIGDNIAVAQALMRAERFNKKHLYALSLKDVAAATATVVQHLDAGTLVVHRSRSLTAAFTNSSWRDSGGSRLLGRIHGKDISALMSVVHGVAALAKAPQRKRAALPTPVAV